MLVEDGKQAEPESVQLTVTGMATTSDPKPPSKADPKVCVYARQARALNLPGLTRLEALCRAAGGTP